MRGKTAGLVFIALWASSLLAGEPALVNGSMTDGEAVPTGWGKTWTPKDGGTLRVVRDTKVFVKGPASLRLETVGGFADGNTSQTIAGLAGRTVVLRGSLRSQDVQYASIALFIRDKNYQRVDWINLVQAWHTTNWKSFNRRLTVPANGANVMLMVYMKGKGKVWADELSLQVVEVTPLPRTKDSPIILHVGAVAPDIIGITIQAGHVRPSILARYVPRPGDKTQVEKNKQGVVREVLLISEGRPVGWLAGPKRDWLCTFEKLIGDALQTEFADLTTEYTITSKDDPAYATGLKPVALWRKSKPSDWAQPGRKFAMRHVIYLKLPKPLAVGKSYAISFGKVNVNSATRTYKHSPATTRSEAVHVSHVGFHPNDPAKRGFLSVWLGTGGAHAYPNGLRFSLIDDRTNQAAYDGKVVLAVAANQAERMKQDVNYNKTNVYRMDFSDFEKPGRYRLYVEGVGCSYRFEVGEMAWRRAYLVSMQGFRNHRSGVRLGVRRPRCYHPEDGVKVFQSTVPLMDTSMGLNLRDKNAFTELLRTKTDETLPQAWGGYMDAGDWDRRIQHLAATRLLLELLETTSKNPSVLDHFSKPVPLVAEALWNIDFYRRLQTKAGGVRGGVEAAAHPVKGEVSWLESLPVMAYAPGMWSSHIYAGVAARAACVLRKIDPKLAKTYEESALRAMNWAEAEYAKWKNDKTVAKRPRQIRDDRNLAALELYRLTGDKKWHAVFLEHTCLKDPDCELFDWKDHIQRDAAFVYARLDDKLADAKLKKTALGAILKEADRCITYSKGNAFGLVSTHKSKPHHMGFYSSPAECVQLVRAHALTGKLEYLKTIVLGTQYCLGANPMNMTFTTGLGHEWPKHPLHIDSRRSGRPAPAGITVYGQFDLELPMHKQGDYFNWPIKWFLARACTPTAWAWPSTEAYHDIFGWPAVNEYTIHQTLGPSSYVWGYLAARR